MKQLVSIVILVILACAMSVGICENSSNWMQAPRITKAYELTAEELYLEWEGNAPLYQVYVDGKSVKSVIVNNAIVPIKKGTHSIAIYPINEVKTADTQIDLGVNSPIIGASFGLDLAALGLDPKQLYAGVPSEALYVDYTVDPIFKAVPDQLNAETDFNDQVILSFCDRYNADEYVITIKNRNDINYIRFNLNSDKAAQLISKNNSTVAITLSREYLYDQGCMIPELNDKYSFMVQLRKYVVNLCTGETIKTVFHESKESKSFNYTPIALWKTAPTITYASQISDGQALLKWEHNDNGLGCTYKIIKINKTLGIKTSEEVVGTTTMREYQINDLMNGTFSYCVIPQYENESGDPSSDVSIEIKNDWVIAPAIVIEQINKEQIKIMWPAAENVETYHITVYEGNNESLLRFVSLDYSKSFETDLPSSISDMEYVYTYDKDYNSEIGQRIKVEVYGVRHTSDNKLQKTAVSSQAIVLK